ncbi:MAG: cysteine-rich small domain-containing protein [Promethearchaeota archaeon]
MLEKGKILINRAIKRKSLTGLDKSCDYLPCHDGLEDCTFCYCPFYPCNEIDTRGFEKINSNTQKPIWACSNCLFIHKMKNSELILEGLISYKKKFEEISREELLKLRSKILENIKK